MGASTMRTDQRLPSRGFRPRLLSRAESIFGTFIKTPTSHAIEIIGGLGFDFVVIDCEHAPFDRRSVDVALLAARTSRIAALVRVADASPTHILAALDDGADGVIVPHVSSPAAAMDAVEACRYAGRRGFSNSPRAGQYGAVGMWPHVDGSDASVAVIAMIEDAAAIEAIDDILAVEGLDGVFIGRGDLAVALDERHPGAPRVRVAAQRVLESARRAGKPVCMLCSDPEDAVELAAQGATAIVISSDQGFLRTAARASLAEFRIALGAQASQPSGAS